jgi:hypothetical protein
MRKKTCIDKPFKQMIAYCGQRPSPFLGLRLWSARINEFVI